MFNRFFASMIIFSVWTLFSDIILISSGFLLYSIFSVRALQQAVGLSVPSPRSCGLYSSIPNVIIGIPRFSIVFHWSFLLSASSFIGVSPSKSLSFYTAKVYGCCGNERVPAFCLCPEKNNDVVCACPNIFFVQNFSNSTLPYLNKP